MITLERLKALARIPEPVLSVYWTLPRFGKGSDTPPPGEWTRLKAAANELLDSLPSQDREACAAQWARLYERLAEASRPPHALVLFVGNGVWESVELPISVESELNWGAPSLYQLLTIVGANKPYGVAVADHSGAWLFRFQAGELKDLQVLSFGLDSSNWKQKDLGHFSAPARVKLNKTRGSQRDAYDHRVEAHYDRFWGVVSDHLLHFQEAEHFAGIFLLGSPRITRQIGSALPPGLMDRVVYIDSERGHSSMRYIREHVIAPRIAAWQRQDDSAVAAALFASDRNAVTDLIEILGLLQRGELHRVLLSPGLDAPVHQCIRCGWVNISADPYCHACHGARTATRLRRVLPQLLLARGTAFTVLTGSAGASLREIGGIAAFRESVEEPTHLHEISAA